MTDEANAQGPQPAPGRGSGQPLSILVVGSGWRFVSGISYYTWQLGTALHEHGHRASVILMRALLPARLYPGRQRVGKALTSQRYDEAIPVFDGVDWWGVPSLVLALRFLRRHRPEVVVLQWWTATVLHSYLLLVLAARRAGAKVVVEFHEVLDSAELRIPLVPRYSRAIARLVMRRVDGVIVHSQYDLDLLRSVYDLQDLPVAVAPHGPFDHLIATTSPVADQTPDGPALADRTTGEPIRLLFFGTIRPYKGLEYLIEAFNSLSEEQAQAFTLTVVGETWEGWTRPAELIADSPHRRRITFVNRYVSDDEAADHLAHADALVLPYLRSSASGPLHMAMSHGLPVVVSEVGGLREAAAGYDGTVFVTPADVPDLVRAFERVKPMVGRRHPDPHSWSRTVQAVEELARTMKGAPQHDRTGRSRPAVRTGH